MTHGYEYFEYEYVDLDEIWGTIDDGQDESIDTEISSLWGQLDGIYEEMSEEAEEFDIYEQEEMNE